MRNFHIPKKEEVLERNRRIFYALEEAMGFVPNMDAFIGNSEYGLESYLKFTETPVVLSEQEIVIIRLITSQLNKAAYCLAAHTAAAKELNFTDEQIIEIRKGNVPFNEKWGILARFICELVEKKGYVPQEALDHFYQIGYTDRHLVESILVIAQTIVTNYIAVITQMPLDFPEAPVVICNCDCRE